jgi:endo-1,4-beta-D-glucanase Y/4-amino-4-deoxy-L-arabinose transferase-like glycosyltransferase
MLDRLSSQLSKFILVLRRVSTPALFVVALLLAGFLHGYNAFYYPYFESDEGTYLFQAFAVKEYGELSIYTYWYDHPPFGWITIAAWVDLLQGDWNFFGNSLNTGRALMLLLHLVQVSLIFFIVNRVSRSPWLAFMAIIIYSTSPLAVYFQRRVLLDNLLTTWVLLSVAILFLQRVQLRHVVMSGVFFGLAMITKITTVMFSPAILFLLLTAKWNIHRGFRLLAWSLVVSSIFSLWLIYAAINTELVPAPEGERVSLIGTILFQASRGTEVPFWHQGSSFMDNVVNWMVLDETYVYLVGFGLVVALLLALFSAQYRFFGLATLLYFLFLIRGGIVIGFYILPMLPFIAMSIVFGADIAIRWLRKRGVPVFAIASIFLVLVGTYAYHYYPKAIKYLTVDETSNQIEALRWVKRELPEDTRIIVDIYGMTELLNPSFENNKKFTIADWYFKVAMDPAIRYEKYLDDWRNFDYVLISHEMIYQSSLNELPVVYDAIRNSEPVMRWDQNSTTFVDVQKFISTNGDWVALHRINNSTRTQLLYAWNYFRDNFIVSYGQVIDPQANVTTSEGQSYGMLRAALMNDSEAFKGMWLWTQHHLQHRLNDRLISWRWQDGTQTDSANATDADLDIALALIFASQRFDEPSYLDDARAIINDIWEHTVVSINGRYHLLPMEKSLARRDNYYLLNPSYFSPAHYRIFAEVDSERQSEWLQLAEDTYLVLGNRMPTNWLMVNDKTGALSSASPYITQGSADSFGYDAFRTFWRVALDESWYKSEDAERYLKNVSRPFVSEWQQYGSFGDLYTAQGGRIRDTSNPAIAAGILSALKVGAPQQVSSDVYAKLFAETLVIDEESEYAYWLSPDNYYESNWIWFGVALYNNNLPNLWRLHQQR